MADSADVLLARVRMGVASQPGEPVGDALEAFHELDELLSAGGPLPTAWVPAADRTVTDVPGPDGDDPACLRR